MSPWLQFFGPAALTAVVALFLSYLDRTRGYSHFSGVIETSMQSVQASVEKVRDDTKTALVEMKADMNRRFDQITESQSRAWSAIDDHNREIGRLQGKVEVIQATQVPVKSASAGRS